VEVAGYIITVADLRVCEYITECAMNAKCWGEI
jgi:hypothetical protein